MDLSLNVKIDNTGDIVITRTYTFLFIVARAARLLKGTARGALFRCAYRAMQAHAHD